MTASTHNLLSRHRFTVDEYHQMGESGILSEQDRVELIEGEIVQMTPIGSTHVSVVNRLNRLLVRRVGDAALVSIQNPVRLGEDSEPEPDVALLRTREDDYESALPSESDVLLIVEVCNSSLTMDRTVKVPLYARHGVPVVWLVDLADRRVEVYSHPDATNYTRTETLEGEELLTLPAVEQLTLTVDEILSSK